MNAQALKQILSLSGLFVGLYLLSFLWQQEQLIEGQRNTAGIVEPSPVHYFENRTIEWIVPFKEGGGADTWARFNAPFFTKHIPGHPVVVVNNIPGGGSIKGGNLFADRAKADGMLLLGTSGTTQMPYLLDDPRVQYDYAKYKPIMAYPNGGVVYCSPKLDISSAKEIEKIREIPLMYASQGPTSLDLVPMFSFDLIGLNVKAVFGFRGRGAGRLAFERGEVLIDYQTSSAYIKNVIPMVESGEAIPLFSFGALDEDGHLARDPSFPELPHFGEVYEQLGYQRTGIEWDTWVAFMSAGFGGMKLLLTPKETPREIVDLYIEGITAMKADPAYQQVKVKALGSYDQLTGKAAEKIFKLATHVDEAEKQFMKNWLREKYGLNI